MMGGTELLLAGAAIAVAFAVPVALVLWMAAQFVQTRALERRVATLEDIERDVAGPVSTPEGPGTDPPPEEASGDDS